LELDKDYLKIVNGQPGMIKLLGDSTIRLASLISRTLWPLSK